MKHIHVLLILALAMLCSCHGSHSIAENIATAELAMANDDVSATREICDKLINTPMEKRSSISATEWARLSMLYMQLNERTDAPEVVELAAQCYKEAFSTNPDSALSYYQNLPVEYDKYAMTLSSIVLSLNNPSDIPADRDLGTAVDSIPAYQ